MVQDGENSQDALICRLFFAKEPLIKGLFREKWPIKIRQKITYKRRGILRFYATLYLLNVLCILDALHILNTSCTLYKLNVQCIAHFPIFPFSYFHILTFSHLLIYTFSYFHILFAKCRLNMQNIAPISTFNLWNAGLMCHTTHIFIHVLTSRTIYLWNILHIFTFHLWNAD